MNHLLQVHSATIQFGGVKALQEVSFHLDQEDLLGLIGPNGAGKTTLMKYVTGINDSKTGHVELSGYTISGLSVYQRVKLGISMSQQLVRPFKSMSFLDNVVFAAGYHKTENPWKTPFFKSRIQE